MTSRKLFANLLKENSKRRLWPIALSIAANFFAQIVYCMLIFGHYKERLEREATNIQDIRIDFYNNVAGLNNWAVLFILCVMAFILAIQGYSYLFDPKQTDLYYSLPIKREMLFDSNNLCGILIFAIPYLICHIITVIMGLSKGYATWNTILLYPASALVIILMFIMCYEICTLAAVLTGHIVVATLGCMVFFFFCSIASFVYEVLMSTFFSSYYSDISFYSGYLRWSPINLMINTISAFQGNADREIAFYTFDAASGMLGIVVLAAFAYVLSRILIKKRPAEAAGKSMAFYITKPLIKMIVMVVGSLGAGILMYFIGSARSLGLFIFGMICGLIVIHIVMETIYEFDFKASLEHRATLIGSAVISALIFICFVFDIFGYETWQPMPSRVESVAIGDQFVYPEIIAPYEKTVDSVKGQIYYQTTVNGTEYALANMKLTDLDKVEIITRQGAINAKNSHKDAIKYDLFSFDYILYDYEDYEGDGYHPDYEMFTVQWNLKDGRKIRRRYRIDVKDEEVLTAYKALFDSEEYKKGRFPVYDIAKGEINTLRSTNLERESDKSLSDEDMESFIKIYSEELMAQSFEDLKNENPTIMLYGTERVTKDYYYTDNKYNFYVFPSFTRTNEFLQQHGISTSWWDGSDGVSALTIERDEWDEENYQNIHRQWNTREKDEIQAVIENVIPEQLYGATGLFYSNDMDKEYTNVYLSCDSKSSSYSEYVFLINTDKLPEKVKEIYFEEEEKNNNDASVSGDATEIGRSGNDAGWISCVTNG